VKDTERQEAARPEDPEIPALADIGPPGWDEFAGARARFMRTLAIQSLEVAWAAPARALPAADAGAP
jgi:hypothetical protein